LFLVGKVTEFRKMKVERFEDLDIWKEARELYGLVFEITSSVPFASDFRFRDQIRAASGSVMDNISEGFDRGGNKEFSQFLSISMGSAAEVRSQSYRDFDSKYIDESQLEDMLKRTESISRKTFTLIQYLKTTDIKGIKYT